MTTLLASLPEAWQGMAREKLASARPRHLEYYRQLTPEALAGSLLVGLVPDPAAIRFVLEQLALLPRASDRVAVVQRAADWPHWRDQPAFVNLLDRLAEQDPSDEVAVAALEVRRLLDARRAQQVLHARAAATEATDRTDAQPVDTTVWDEADRRWSVLMTGSLLPDFWRQPPPVFTADVPASPLRVVAFGDTGAINGAVTPVPDVLRRYTALQPLSMGLVLGDNFHPRPTSPDDPRFAELWEARYGALGVPFYAVLGNKEWHGGDAAAAQLAYSLRSTTWRMPAVSYSFIAGPAQFFALGAPSLAHADLRWLARAIEESRSPWKIVFGHVPLEYRRDLAELLRGRVDAYFASYARLEHSEPLPGLNQFISGTAGVKSCKRGIPDTVASKFSSGEPGFAAFDLDERRLTLSFIDSEGRAIYRTTLDRR